MIKARGYRSKRTACETNCANGWVVARRAAAINLWPLGGSYSPKQRGFGL